MKLISLISAFVSSLVDALLALNDLLWSEFVIVPLLLFTGAFFTYKFKAVQLTMIPDMIKSVVGSKSMEHHDKNSISSFEAFAVGLASRVGTGNIAGVAIAITLGGPGAIFWMWIAAILGAASAFVESTLAQLYKIKDPETKFRGGPAYYIRDGLGSKKLGGLFAVFISVAFGLAFNSVQSNTISGSISNAFNVTAENELTVSIIVAVVLVVLTGAVLFLGAHAIAKVTTFLVPIMAVCYLVLATIIVILQFEQIPAVFSLIVSSAFAPEAIYGGIAGAMINGVKRGLFSNEAGMGSAPNAAATADADHPVTQGLIQSLGVFIDTLVICSATGFIILVSGVDYSPGVSDGIVLTGDAMEAVLGSWSLNFLTFAIFCFAFSSILGNYYYSQSNIEYLSDNKISVVIFKIMVLGMVFLGAIVPTAVVWTLADLAMALMALLNIYAILRLYPYVVILLKDYKEQKAAKKTIMFDSSKYEETKKFELWNR